MEEGIVALIIAPLIIFMIFVAPIWLILHYRSKKQVSQGLSPEDYKSLKELAVRAEKMSDRYSIVRLLSGGTAHEVTEDTLSRQ